ncbi:MAG: hypothetical protein U0527_10620 [Candidatus Eisenbacteria bacterium]
MNSRDLHAHDCAPWLGILALACAGSAVAGPNAGGTLILHTNPSLVYCQGLTYCGQIGITSCDQAITRHDGGDPTVFFALAAFPAAASPRLQGIVFSLQYDSAQMAVIDYGQCGDFELHSNDWPGPNSYTGITWNTAQTQHLVGVCWFVAYSYDPQMPTSFGMYGSRGSNCCFADDSVPAKTDQIAAFGELGFNQPGVLPCPDAPPPLGACCLGCSCAVVQQTECDAMGGTFMGPNTSCSPNICGAPPAVCCVNEQCTIVTSCECQALGGEYLSDVPTCDGDPCVAPTPTQSETWGRVKARYR